MNRPKISSDKKLRIEFIGSREPNNGRMLLVIDVFYADKNINETIFQGGDWNMINYSTDNWTINDIDNKFYYIPVEEVSKLIVKENLRIIDLPNQPLSTVRFIGNTFIGDNLVEVYRDQIVITNLNEFTSNIKTLEGINHVDEFRIIDNSALEVFECNYHENTKLSRRIEL